MMAIPILQHLAALGPATHLLSIMLWNTNSSPVNMWLHLLIYKWGIKSFTWATCSRLQIVVVAEIWQPKSPSFPCTTVPLTTYEDSGVGRNGILYLVGQTGLRVCPGVHVVVVTEVGVASILGSTSSLYRKVCFLKESRVLRRGQRKHGVQTESSNNPSFLTVLS